jgi:hypothetical protein
MKTFVWVSSHTPHQEAASHSQTGLTRGRNYEVESTAARGLEQGPQKVLYTIMAFTPQELADIVDGVDTPNGPPSL